MAFRFLKKLESLADQKSYPAIVAALAALDAFVLIIPTEVLLVSAVLIRPRKWISISIYVSIGSAIGAASFAWLCGHYGISFINSISHGALDSKYWMDAQRILNHHCLWGLTLISFSPFPQHVAVAVAGLAHVHLWVVFGSVLVGRSFKYLIFSYLAVRAPQVLVKLGLLQKI